MNEVIGLIPAAGKAERIGPAPCSKEIYPIGLSSSSRKPQPQPMASCQYVLEAMRFAGIRKLCIVLRSGKWDIPSYLSALNPMMSISYLVMETSPGVPYTLDHAYPFLKDSPVAFGFPDLVFHGKDVFAKLLARQRRSRADLLLGLFAAERPDQLDMVRVNGAGAVKEIRIKPKKTRLRYTWGVALWTPVFTEFLHSHLAIVSKRSAQTGEISVGHIFQAAIRHKLRIEAIPVSEASYIDIGTPGGLRKALRQFAAS